VSRGLDDKTQVILPVIYKGVRIDAGFRLDLVGEDKVMSN